MVDEISAGKNDLSFARNGDFVIEQGDLQDTFHIEGLGFIEEVEIRVASSQNDWYFEVDKGADLDIFEGRMITPALEENIKESISRSLTYDGFLSESAFQINVARIDVDELAVKIIFSDNITKYVDYKIQDVRIVFDLRKGTPKIVR